MNLYADFPRHPTVNTRKYASTRANTLRYPWIRLDKSYIKCCLFFQETDESLDDENAAIRLCVHLSRFNTINLRLFMNDSFQKIIEDISLILIIKHIFYPLKNQY